MSWLDPMEPELRQFYDRWVPAVQQAIRDWFPRTPGAEWLQALARVPAPEPWDMAAVQDAFTDPVWSYLDRGGKILRPVLTAAVLSMLDQKVERSLPLLAAIEVLEASSIIVDDASDDSATRRGGPTTHVAYNSLPLATNAGYGVFKHTLALFYNNQMHLPEETALALLDAFAEENYLIAAGHAEEYYWTEQRAVAVTEAQYYQEIIARMAFLSFRGPCRMAGLVAGAPAPVVDKLSRLGLALGVAYHLRGDLLNLEPASADWGKDLGDDLTGGRRTLPVIRTLAVATAADRERLLAILDARTRDAAVLQKGIAIIRRYDAAGYVRQCIDDQAATVMAILAELPGRPAEKELIAQFLRFAGYGRVN